MYDKRGMVWMNRKGRESLHFEDQLCNLIDVYREFQKTGGWCRGDQWKRLETVSRTGRDRLHGSGFDACSNHNNLIEDRSLRARNTWKNHNWSSHVLSTRQDQDNESLRSTFWFNITCMAENGNLDRFPVSHQHQPSSSPRFHQNCPLHISASIACSRATLQCTADAYPHRNSRIELPKTTQASSSFEISLPGYI